VTPEGTTAAAPKPSYTAPAVEAAEVELLASTEADLGGHYPLRSRPGPTPCNGSCRSWPSTETPERHGTSQNNYL
jgi:hypothetical protein